MAHVLPKLGFGVELEMLLKPKGDLMKRLNQKYKTQGLVKYVPKPKDWAHGLEIVKNAQMESDTPATKQNAERFRLAFREIIAEFLSKAENISTTLNSTYYTQWSVEDEVSLEETSGYCKFANGSRFTVLDSK